MLPFILALLAVAALLPIVTPLLRGSRPGASRGSFDKGVYRDQLRELDRDIVRGLINASDADPARLEIQRRLLAADNIPNAPPRLSRSPTLAGLVLVTIAAGSTSSYLRLGAPDVPDEPFSARTKRIAPDDGQSTVRQAAAAMSEKLHQNPFDAPVWLLYGRTLSMLSQWDQAEDAYRHAMDLGQTGPDVAVAHAEMVVMLAGGTVVPAAEAAFRAVLKADPGSGISRFYLALASRQAGQPRKAVDEFLALLAELPADSPFRNQLGRQVIEAAEAAGIPVPDLAKETPPAGVVAPHPAATAEAANRW